MNRAIRASIAALAVAASITIAGCGGSESADVITGADMKGTWAQTGTGYQSGKLTKWGTARITFDQADGQTFGGYKTFTPNDGGAPVKRTMQGVISPDGEILITDSDGFYEGTVENGVFTGDYAEMGDDAAAMSITMTKQ